MDFNLFIASAWLVNAIFKENVASCLVALALLFDRLLGFALLIGLIYKYLIKVW